MTDDRKMLLNIQKLGVYLRSRGLPVTKKDLERLTHAGQIPSLGLIKGGGDGTKYLYDGEAVEQAIFRVAKGASDVQTKLPL